jgi:hypothetical protein
MAAGKYNFIVEQGSQHVLTFTYTDDQDVAINLGDMTVRMAVKDHISNTAFVYRATSDATVDTAVDYRVDFEVLAQAGAQLGQFKLTIPSAITEDFTFNQGVYDLEILDGLSATRLLEGKFKVKPQVSV